MHNVQSTQPREQQHSCTACGGEKHPLYSCAFKNTSINAKQEHVRNHRLCFNCLSFGHRTRECRNPARCMKCNRHHHTIFHRDGVPSTHADNPNTLPVAEQPPQMPAVHSATNVKPTLQMTSVVILESLEGQQLQARALLDPGASYTLITNELHSYCNSRCVPRS